MDDPILIMAIVTFGLFWGVVATGIYYIMVIRPRLITLEPRDQGGGHPLPPMIDLTHSESLEEVQSSLDDLRSTLEIVNQRSGSQLDQQRLSMQELGERIITRLESLSQIETLLRETRQDFAMQQQHYARLQVELQTQTQALHRQIVALSDQVTQQNQAMADVLKNQAGQLSTLSEQARVITEQTQPRSLLDQFGRQINSLTSKLDGIKKQRPPHLPARLSDIKGIGPVYSGMLHEAGIEDFDQLAALTPDEVRNLIKVPRWRRINAESWIEQARLYASQRQKLEEQS